MFVMLALLIGFYLRLSIAQMDVGMAFMNQEESAISAMQVVSTALEQEILDVILARQDTLITLVDALTNALMVLYH